jgi:ribonucleoside-diphosphate reductase beta chain
MPLLTASKQYKPFEYPWAFEYWKRQQQIHWMPEEVPLGEDCRDWAQKLTEHERSLLTQIFRFFTQADVEVQDCYHDKYGRVFKPTEVKMMLTAFSNMETVHIAAYSHLLDTIGMPESEYSAFMQYKEMKDKHDYLATFGVDTDEDIAKTLAMFGGFTEGLQLFASFAMLMNFPRFNKMKGMGQIVSWSVRDESLHCEGITRLFHAFVKERDCYTPAVRKDIRDGLPPHGRARGRLYRPRLRNGPGPRNEPQGDQAIHPLYSRLAPRPARPQAHVHDRRPPAAVACAAPQRRRARQLLRDAGDRIFQGGDPGELGRGVGQLRPQEGGQGGERWGRGWRGREAGR